MKWALILAVALPAVMLSSAGFAKDTAFEPGCDAANDIKTSGEITSIKVTGVGGSAPHMLSVHLSNRNTYHTRADTSAGLFAGYVALFTSAHFDKTPLTVHYGCDVGMRVIHFVDLP